MYTCGETIMDKVFFPQCLRYCHSFLVSRGKSSCLWGEMVCNDQYITHIPGVWLNGKEVNAHKVPSCAHERVVRPSGAKSSFLCSAHIACSTLQYQASYVARKICHEQVHRSFQTIDVHFDHEEISEHHYETV